MQFSLMGFSQDIGFRVFVFEGMAADRTRSEYTVRADLTLIRRYGIQMQDLPLLCRGLLERNTDDQALHAMTFTEEEMCLHLRACTEARNAALLKRKLVRRPLTVKRPGVGWRATQLPQA